MEGYIEELDQLITLKKIKGHKISKAESEDFERAWKALITAENGFTNLAERYFYDGFIFAGAKPFIDWVISSENPSVALNSLFKGVLFGKDTAATFRILISSLACLLAANVQDGELICTIIMRIPSASKNKERKTIGDGHKILVNYFISKLDSTAVYPALSALDIKPVFVNEFKHLFDELLGKIDPNSLSKKEVLSYANIVAWLHPENEKSAKAPSEETAVPRNTHILSGAITVNASTKEAVVPTTMPANEPDLHTLLSETLKKATDISAQLCMAEKASEKRAEAAAETIISLRNDIDSLNTRITSAKRHEDDLTAQLADCHQQISSLSTEKEVLEHKVEILYATISEKNDEIAQRAQMVDALSRDRARQSDELVKRLASSLKVEYRDFSDAVTLPMSSDLGENMREQLKNVFSILIKAGILLD